MQKSSSTLGTRAAWISPAMVAVCAWVAVVLALDPAGDHPQAWSGPGLTVDESFNVAQGVNFADRLFALDLAGFRDFDRRLPDHPPLGRLWIGLCHEFAYLIWPPADRSVPYSITCARTASATAFGLLVWLVGWYASRWYGTCGGLAAGVATAIMPRTFGHAHLAALETMVNLTTVGTILYLANRWGDSTRDPFAPRRPEQHPHLLNRWPWLTAAGLGGFLFGLALLTKVQAVLLPIPVAIWMLWHFRVRGAVVTTIWGLVGLAVFFACWPYLWDAPLEHFRHYLGRTTDRAVLYVWYFGESIADRDVPWHYPWLMFLVTVPAGLHLLGAWGLAGPHGRAWGQRREQLLLACGLFPLVVFSVPGVAVYDGERLFSFVFPLWAVLIGRGAAGFHNWLAARRPPHLATLVLSLFLAVQAYPLWALAPAWLSYYNLGTGGLPGATQWGLETSYWGDGLTRPLLDETASRVAPGGTVAVLPTLHAAQWEELRRQCPSLNERQIRLAPWGTPAAAEAEYVLLFVRPEYLPPEVLEMLHTKTPVAALRRQGVVLAALFER
ncbi:MAG: hypothetical protein JSS02_01585 [Planctomycetes bacterium]|nr:hypothetical protein [Planctomycetota bacterium]